MAYFRVIYEPTEFLLESKYRSNEVRLVATMITIPRVER